MNFKYFWGLRNTIYLLSKTDRLHFADPFESFPNTNNSRSMIDTFKKSVSLYSLIIAKIRKLFPFLFHLLQITGLEFWNVKFGSCVCLVLKIYNQKYYLEYLPLIFVQCQCTFRAFFYQRILAYLIEIFCRNFILYFMCVKRSIHVPKRRSRSVLTEDALEMDDFWEKLILL